MQTKPPYFRNFQTHIYPHTKFQPYPRPPQKVLTATPTFQYKYVSSCQTSLRPLNTFTYPIKICLTAEDMKSMIVN